MKKLFILTLILALGLSKTAFAMADEAFGACIMNGATGEVIWQKDGYERHSMASTTKIMTAVAALESCSIYDVVNVGPNAAGVEGSSMYLMEGDTFLMNDLLYGLMLNSGNDAAVAIAEHVSGSSEAFAALMTDISYNRIGALDTQFMNPNGLDADGHYTTACDLAAITRYALKNENFRRLVSTRFLEVHPQNSTRLISLANHNKLLGSYDGCIGVKTGYTKNTGRCLVSAAERDGMTFIAVTLDDENDWDSHREMLDYCFDNYRPVHTVKAGESVRSVFADGKYHKFVYSKDIILPIKNDEEANIEVRNYITSFLVGNINAGEKVGFAEIICDGNVADTVDIVSEDEISSMGTLKLKRSFLGIFNRMTTDFLF